MTVSIYDRITVDTRFDEDTAWLSIEQIRNDLEWVNGD